MATTQLNRQTLHPSECTISNPLTLRHLPVEISFRDQVISSHYVFRLREEIGLDRHRLFLQAKYKWTDHIWDSIAWDSFYVCARRTIKKNSPFRSKLVHNWLHLGHRRKHLSHSHHTTTVIQLCPMCSSPEDFQHFLTCKSPRALKIRYEASARLTKSLRDFPNLGSLLHAIREWTLDPTTSLSPSTISDTKVAVAITNQSHIGWANLFRGFISADWGC